MAEFRVDSGALCEKADRIRAMQKTLDEISLKLAGMQIGSLIRIKASTALIGKVNNCRVATENEAAALSSFAASMRELARCYERTEKDLSEPKNEPTNPWLIPSGIDWIKYITVLSGVIPGTIGGNVLSYLFGGVLGEMIFSNPTTSNRFFTSETSWKWKAEHSLKDKEFGVEGSAKWKGSLYTGQMSGQNGDLSGDVKVSVGELATEGSIGATLFSGGVFAPALYLKGKASVKAATIEGKTQYGNDLYNVHGTATGDLGVAEVSGKVEVGTLTYTLDGVTYKSYGVGAEAGAEAYVFGGSVSGGFTIFGIKIDASISGKALGAGAKVGGSVSTNGIGGQLDLGLGVGAGVKFNVDWSNFKWPWVK